MVLDEQLRAKAAQIAQRLRKAGRRVDLVLESKKMKWVFKVCSPLLTLCCVQSPVPMARVHSELSCSDDSVNCHTSIQM